MRKGVVLSTVARRNVLSFARDGAARISAASHFSYAPPSFPFGLSSESNYAWIESLTEISTDHLTPELRLRLIGPRSPAQTMSEEAWRALTGGAELPFWGFYWPGGQAVARFVLDHPEHVRGKTVLDLGAGSGAGSIAAIMSKARRVHANDIDEMSLLIARINAECNGIISHSISIVLETGSRYHHQQQHQRLILDRTNWLELAASTAGAAAATSQHDNDAICGASKHEQQRRDPFGWDCVLVGDMFYDADMARSLMRFLDGCLERGADVLVGDPGRLSFRNVAGLQEGRFRLLKSYPLPASSVAENSGFSQCQVFQLLAESARLT